MVFSNLRLFFWKKENQNSAADSIQSVQKKKEVDPPFLKVCNREGS